jgi:alpha-glucoside transport system permease protein
MDISVKFLTMVLAILLFVAVVGVILFIAGRTERRSGRLVGYVFLFPSLLMLSVGLLFPAARTIYQSFFDAAGNAFIGLGNYQTIATSSDELLVLRNTVLWVVVTPFVATAIGLLYAILVDGARAEAFAKALIFLPMAISMVAASIIWKFMYAFWPDQPGIKQIGLINQVVVWLGGSPQQSVAEPPWNTLFLIVSS